VLELEAARERTAEAPEWLAVLVSHQQATLLLATLAFSGEVKPRAIVEGDRVQRLEGHRAGFDWHAVDPDPALGTLGRIVDPAHQVPADPAPVPGPADTARPAPNRVMGVVSGRLVLHAAARHSPPSIADPDVALDGDIDAFSRPDIFALPARAHRLDPGAAAHAHE